MPVALVLSVCSRRDDNLLDIQNYGNALLVDKHDRELTKPFTSYSGCGHPNGLAYMNA